MTVPWFKYDWMSACLFFSFFGGGGMMFFFVKPFWLPSPDRPWLEAFFLGGITIFSVICMLFLSWVGRISRLFVIIFPSGLITKQVLNDPSSFWAEPAPPPRLAWLACLYETTSPCTLGAGGNTSSESELSGSSRCVGGSNLTRTLRPVGPT